MGTTTRKRTKTENFTLRLEVTRKESLLELAATKGVSPSEFVRSLIAFALANAEAATTARSRSTA
ncbi:MAG: hypothetical protein WCK63_16405 [Betaproteobacteria bacterium]